MSAALFQTPLSAALKEVLLTHMPSYTLAFNTKSEFETHHTYELTSSVIDTALFLRFNTKKFTNILIFDIDIFPEFDYKPTLSQIHEHFYNITGFEPTWTVATERGYHIGIVLKEGIFNTHQDNHTPSNQYQALVKLKQHISKDINADENASNRTVGIWRNPLTHEHIFTAKTYALEELLSTFDIPLKKERPLFITGRLLSNNANLTMKKDPHNKILAAIDAGFYVGNRNNYLFAYGYKVLFEDRSVEQTLESLLLAENNQHPEPLSTYEVKMICKSIIKLLPTMYASNTMKQRGKLSDIMWKNNIHGISQRRAFAGWYTSKERRTSTLKKITQSLVDALDTGKTLNTQNLAAQVQKSAKTIQRYEQNYNLKSICFLHWHKANAKKLQSEQKLHKIDIRPFVQKELMAALCTQFTPFVASKDILSQDRTRKIRYLKALYPLIA